jgi:hypothetical protein
MFLPLFAPKPNPFTSLGLSQARIHKIDGGALQAQNDLVPECEGSCWVFSHFEGKN